MQPKITVITVCFNASDEIEQTILSVINQTYSNIEYLIIDGGSTDNTIDVIKKYEGKITKWVSEPDRGIYDAMNKGIKMASGEWLNMMNAGDRFENDHVLENVFSINYPSNITFLYSDSMEEYNDGRIYRTDKSHKELRLLHQASIYRRSLHEEHGYYVVTPKIIVSDLLFFASIPENEFKKLPFPIASYKVGGVSSGGWCIDQALCVKVVFRKLSFGRMLIIYVLNHLKMKIPILRYLQRLILGR